VASAAAAVRAEVIATCDAATVLVTVTYQMALLPSRYGIDVNPSGHFPSDLVNPCGSLTDGMPALVNESQIKCSDDAVLFQDCACMQEKAWVPRLSTLAMQVFGT